MVEKKSDNHISEYLYQKPSCWGQNWTHLNHPGRTRGRREEATPTIYYYHNQNYSYYRYKNLSIPDHIHYIEPHVLPNVVVEASWWSSVLWIWYMFYFRIVEIIKMIEKENGQHSLIFFNKICTKEDRGSSKILFVPPCILSPQILQHIGQFPG